MTNDPRVARGPFVVAYIDLFMRPTRVQAASWRSR